MKHPIRTTVAALALFGAAPAAADIIEASPSDAQGILVHGVGEEQTDTEVLGQLGVGSGVGVHFTGTTTSETDELRIQDGTGQADVTGAEIEAGGTPNDTFPIESMNIFLDGNAGFSWIELSLAGVGSVDFTLTDTLGNTFDFFDNLLGSGQNKFAFSAIDGQLISNLSYVVNDGGVETVKQVRIDPAAAVVPEPATWAMMLFGFGAVGFAMRRKRPAHLTQIA